MHPALDQNLRWPDSRITELLKIELPILQAPMAGAQDSDLAIAVCKAGGLGSLPCAMLTVEVIRNQVALLEAASSKSFNLNFFCHPDPVQDSQREQAWKKKLEQYYAETGIDQPVGHAAVRRRPFDEASCELVEELKPAVTSFHFGLPRHDLLERVRRTGSKIFSSATTVSEANWLADRGCDAIIAQGFEAGGHRATFLGLSPATQIGTFALITQIVDAVSQPVIAAGGIMDGRRIAAAFALGASGVQLGTAYLKCPEARISRVHGRMLGQETVLTNVFSGRPARGIVNRFISEMGPLSEEAPDFPLAGDAVAALRKVSEERDSPDYAQMWSGQAAALCREMSAEQLTLTLAAECRALFKLLHG